MHARGRRALQDLLTATRLGVPVEQAGYALFPNGERHLRPLPRLQELYPAELLAATLDVAARCAFSLDELRYEYPREIVPEGETPASWLRRLTEEGERRRWPHGTPASARALIEHELALIAELRYEAYFLTVHDVVRYARSPRHPLPGPRVGGELRGVLLPRHHGGGPGAHVALVRAVHLRERNEPPDIDVDFEHERREEVIQYLYEKYGRERAALAATVITLPPAQRDARRGTGDGARPAAGQRARPLHAVVGRRAGQRGARARRRPRSRKPRARPRARASPASCSAFRGTCRSTWAGSSSRATRSSELVPIENAAMPDRTVIQWDKDDLDALGLLKVDVLGLGMLTAIRRAFDLVERLPRHALTLATVPAEDPSVYDMIGQADTVGVFQIESPRADGDAAAAPAAHVSTTS